MKLFIELCKAKDSWHGLAPEERSQFLKPVGAVMRHLTESGVEVVAWGENAQQTRERAPYDFFAVFKFPDEASAAGYEQLFRSAGWYDFFDQVNVMGEVQSHEPVLKALIEM